MKLVFFKKSPSYKQLKQLVKQVFQDTTNFSFVKREVKSFVVISQERVGSTLLMDTLGSHPQISVDCHCFFTYKKLPHKFQIIKRQDYVRSRKNVYGYKFRASYRPLEDDPEQFRELLQQLISRGTVVIRLNRENKFLQVLSSLKVKHSGRLHSTDKSNKREVLSSYNNTFNSFYIDTDTLLEKIKYYELLSNFEETSLQGLPYISLTYEENLERSEYRKKTSERIFNALDLQPFPITTRYEKISKIKPFNYISNYDQVIECLRNEGYERYLDSL
jgi:LPS sulfotransferase NodH